MNWYVGSRGTLCGTEHSGRIDLVGMPEIVSSPRAVSLFSGFGRKNAMITQFAVSTQTNIIFKLILVPNRPKIKLQTSNITKF